MTRARTWMLGLVVVMAGLGWPARTPAQNFAVVGGEQFFKIDWQHGPHRGQPYVWGYVGNGWGMPAADVSLRVQAIDRGGAVTGEAIERIPGFVMPGSRRYFETPVPLAADYRVTVLTYTWLQTGGGGGSPPP